MTDHVARGKGKTVRITFPDLCTERGVNELGVRLTRTFGVAAEHEKRSLEFVWSNKFDDQKLNEVLNRIVEDNPGTTITFK